MLFSGFCLFVCFLFWRMFKLTILLSPPTFVYQIRRKSTSFGCSLHESTYYYSLLLLLLFYFYYPCGKRSSLKHVQIFLCVGPMCTTGLRIKKTLSLIKNRLYIWSLIIIVLFLGAINPRLLEEAERENLQPFIRGTAAYRGEMLSATLHNLLPEFPSTWMACRFIVGIATMREY